MKQIDVGLQKFASPVDHSAVAADWEKRGYSCNLFVDRPHQEWLGFVHSTNELVTVIDGSLKVTINGQTAILNPGDEVFIAKDDVHDVVNNFDGTTRWLFGYD